MIRAQRSTLGVVLTVRPTKMLARQLGINVPAEMPTVSSRVADWCAHSFTFGRSRWLIFCNTASLYPVFAHARGVNDGEALVRRLGGMVNQVLQDNGHARPAEGVMLYLLPWESHHRRRHPEVAHSVGTDSLDPVPRLFSAILHG